MTKKSKRRAERFFSYSPPSTNPKEAKMAARLTSKEHEVGKEQRHSQDDVLKQISDSIKCLGDILQNKIEQPHTDMD